MAISSALPPVTASLQNVQTNPSKPRDPDHDGDVDKAGQPDIEKSSTSSFLNIKA